MNIDLETLFFLSVIGFTLYLLVNSVFNIEGITTSQAENCETKHIIFKAVDGTALQCAEYKIPNNYKPPGYSVMEEGSCPSEIFEEGKEKDISDPDCKSSNPSNWWCCKNTWREAIPSIIRGPKCPIDAGLTNECTDLILHASSKGQCSDYFEYDETKGFGYQCKRDPDRFQAGVTLCAKDDTAKCIPPQNYSDNKCNNKGWELDNGKCHCPGTSREGVINPLGYGYGAVYYTGDHCENTCNYKDNILNCPCGENSPSCGPWLSDYECPKPPGEDSPKRYCQIK
jgi:hypothetical protein